MFKNVSELVSYLQEGHEPQPLEAIYVIAKAVLDLQQAGAPEERATPLPIQQASNGKPNPDPTGPTVETPETEDDPDFAEVEDAPDPTETEDRAQTQS